jgi:hypothetical protein
LEGIVIGPPTGDAEPTEDREPDPARSYERAKPEKEAGMGRMDDPAAAATPTDRPDLAEQAVHNAHAPRQLNADDVTDARAPERPGGLAPGFSQPDHPMLEEEPLGEDLMPTDIHDPRAKRHPRKEGRGGTP